MSTILDVFKQSLQTAFGDGASLQQKENESEARVSNYASAAHNAGIKYSSIRGFVGGVTRTQKQNEAAAKALADATKYDTEDQYNQDITSQLSADQKYLTIVNNATTSNGTRSTQYGYLESHCDDIANGTVCLIDNQGNIEEVDLTNASEDYLAQVNEFKAGYTEAKDKFELAKKFQEMAEEGNDESHVDTEDSTQTNSALDIITNTINLIGKTAEMKQQVSDIIYNSMHPETTAATLSKNYIEGNWEDDVTQYGDSLVDFIETRQLAQLAYDKLGDVSYYQDKYTSSPMEAIEELMNSDKSEREKNYIAYKMVSGEEKSLADYATQGGLNVLADMGESLDWLANPVKGTVQYLYYKYANPETSAWYNEEHAEWFEDKDYGDVLSSMFQATWKNEGRKAYNYDTGFIGFDMALEIISDPEFLISMGGAFLKNSASESAVTTLKNAGYDISDKESKNIGKLFKKISNDASQGDLIEAITKHFPVESRAGIRTVLTESDEYAKAFRISQSLGKLNEAKNMIDKAMLWSTGLPLTGKAVSKIVNAITNGVGIERAGEKILIDSLTETLGRTGTDRLTIDITDEFFDRVAKNSYMLTMDNIGTWKPVIDQASKLDIVEGVYQSELYNAYALAKDAIPNGADVRTSAQFIEAKHDIDSKFIECLVRNDLTDAPIYSVLTRQGYDGFSAAKTSPITDRFMASAELLDVHNAEELGERVNKYVDSHVDIDRAAYEELDKIYVPKLNDKVTAEMYMNNEAVQRMMNTMYEGDYSLLATAADTSSTGTAKATRKMLNLQIGVDNYNTISAAIDSTALPTHMKNQLKDTLYNSKLKRRAARLMTGGVDCTDEYMMKEARSYAKALCDESMGLQAYYQGVHVDLDDLSTWDTAANVQAIEKRFNEFDTNELGIKAEDKVIFYSACVDQNGNLINMSFKTAENTYNTVSPELIEDTLLNEVYNTASDVKIHFVSACNHAANYDVDSYVRKYFMSSTFNKAKYWFQETTDIVELERIAVGDIPKLTDQTVDAIEQAVYQSMKHWQEMKCMYRSCGLMPKCSFTGPSYRDLEQLKDLLADVNVSSKTEQDIYNYIAPELTKLTTEQETSNAILNLTVGKFKTDGPQLYAAAGNDIGMKLAYDYRKISHYLDIDDMKISEAMIYEDMAEQLDNIQKSWRADVDHLLYTFRDDIDKIWDKVSPDFDVRIKKGITIQDKVAIMQYYFQQDSNIFYSKIATVYNKATKSMQYYNPFLEAIENPYEFLQGQSKIRTMAEIAPDQWEVLAEKLPGSLDNPYSSYNQMFECNKQIQALDSKFETHRELEEYLEGRHLNTELGKQRVQTKTKLFERYYGLREELRELQESEFAHIHSDALHDAATPLQKFEANKYSPKGFSNINKDMAVWYQDRALQGVIFQDALSDEDWLSYMYHYCNNKMVIAKQYIDDAKVSTLMNRPGVTVTDNNRFYMVSITPSKKYIEDTVPAIDKWEDLHFSLPNQCQESMHYLAELNDESFKYGIPVAYDANMNNFIVNKFFDGNKDMLDVGSRSQYLCGYMGPIDDLFGEGSYVSGNLYSNLFNAYNQTYTKLMTAEDIVDNMFSGVSLRDYIAGSDLDTVKEWAAANDKIAIYKTYDGQIGTIVDWSKHMDDDITFLSPIELRQLEQGLKHGLDKDSKIMTAIKKIRKAESLWICGYLYSNVATWAHNWVDSTTKAWIAEGSDHFYWMTEAIKTNKQYEDLLDTIAGLKGYKHNGFVTLDDIDNYYRYHSGVKEITQERAKQMWMYWDSSISESKYGDYFKQASESIPDKITEKFGNIPLVKFNADKFSQCESINRTAIYLNHINAGETFNSAYEAIKMSQFDYAKNNTLTVLDTLMPFSTFKLYNYQFWLDSMWNTAGAANKVNGLIELYKNDQEDRYSDYWDEETLNYRAWLDTLDFERDQKGYLGSYNKFEDFMGNKKETASEMGWVSIGDKLYLKLGLSLIDAVTGLATIADPQSSLFTLFNPDTYSDLLSAWDDFGNPDVDASQWIADHGYDTINMLPMLGTAYYMVESGYRNYKMYDRLNENGTISSTLTTILPGLFAPGDYKTYDRTNPTDKPIGLNWYDMSEDERKLYQYVNGVSYIKSWVASDPANYVNHWGRMQELTGFDNDQMSEFMELGGGFWFSENNEGKYELHNYKLINNDAETYNKLYNKLISYGWTPDRAYTLLEECSENPWRSQYSNGTYQYSNQYSATSSGYGRYNMSSYLYNQIRYAGADSEYSKFSGAWSRYDKHPKQYTLASRMAKGKNVDSSQYSEYRAARGDNPGNFRRTTHKWHTRTRDIYSNNYARYGASRMAMEQNLKNYSNRSITEMRRTNQTLRYADIHRHTAW